MSESAPVVVPHLADDAHWMRRALELAARGRGWVEPNPVVGAVIVKNGRIVGEGYHEKFGGPHAEIHALRAAGSQAAGATVYVTLEPCCHTGKTGPCTRALMDAGVSRVVAAVLDPNPLVAGKGVLELRCHGISITLGPCAGDARRLNAPFFKLITVKRPFVIAKWAQTLDGALADRFHSSKWISCEESRQEVHVLRGRVDAVLVGIGTVLADDPLLTARPQNPADVRRRALRCVLDSECRLPLKSRLVETAREFPTVVFHGRDADAAIDERRRRLADRGIECVAIGPPPSEDGRLNMVAVMEELGRRMIGQVLVEGGAQVLGQLLRQHLVDEARVYVAPKILGDDQACRITVLSGIRLDQAPAGEVVERAFVGRDVRIVLKLN